MNKRYLLWGVFFVIASVLISLFIINGCSSSKHLFKKELKYPDWPGLDEQINEYEEIISQDTEINYTNFTRMEIKPEYINWHISFVFGVSRFWLFNGEINNSQVNSSEKEEQELKNIFKQMNCEIFKLRKDTYNRIETRKYYVKLNNQEDLKNVYFYFKKLEDKWFLPGNKPEKVKKWKEKMKSELNNVKSKNYIIIEKVKINPLIEYSPGHYRPISDATISITFKKELSQEKMSCILKVYSIKKYRKMFSHTYRVYIPSKEKYLYYYTLFEKDNNIIQVSSGGWGKAENLGN
ncbi:hypothetical protein KAU33_02255 [Candidatus Dependentiae bacterium]|nr:hypothetical protein [Candidatus Dependentiae bacterium]